jgi:hypothetical protein
MSEAILSPEGFYITEDDGVEEPDESRGLGIDSAAYNNNPLVPDFAVPEGVSEFEDGKIIRYEDEDFLYNYYVYDGDIMVSFLETDKKTGKMVQHVFTPTGTQVTSATANEVDYKSRSELFGDISSDVLDANDRQFAVDETDAAKTYDDFTETLIPIASIGPHGVLIPE